MRRLLIGICIVGVVMLCLTSAAAESLFKNAEAAIGDAYGSSEREMRPSEFDKSVLRYVKNHFGKSAMPQRIRGDFDGNKLQDFALFIRRGNAVKLVAMNQVSREAWTIRELYSGTYTGGLQGGMSKYTIFITLRRPGTIAYWPDDGKGKSGRLKLKHDGIELNFYGKASTLFYWNGKGFPKVQTGD